MNMLEQEFIDFIKSMDAHVEIHGDETDETGYTTVTYKKGDFWYNGSPGFNDFNKEIAYKEKLFGIRSDDNFWTEALLPFKFRLLDVDFICSVLWKDRECETSPVYFKDKKSIERMKWEAERFAEFFEYNRPNINLRLENGESITNILNEVILTKWHRYTFLKNMSVSDPLYKHVKKYKMHKRYGYLARLSRPRNKIKLVSIKPGTVTFLTKKRAIDLGVLDKWEAAGK